MSRTIQQAGAVTFRTTSGAPEILLVKARKNPEHWIFPKGHIEPGESSQEAAIRELSEEAGVLGDIVEPLGALEFQDSSNTVRVEYYLCRFREQIDSGEGREMQWCSPERAIALLPFPDMRDLVRKAYQSTTEPSSGS